MTTAEVLRKARAFLAAGWTQGHYALDEQGIKTDTHSPDACSFCMAGALMRATPDPIDSNLWVEAKNAVKAVIGGQTLVSFNDTVGRTQDQVLAAFDRAIAAEEAKAVTP